MRSKVLAGQEPTSPRPGPQPGYESKVVEDPTRRCCPICCSAVNTPNQDTSRALQSSQGPLQPPDQALFEVCAGPRVFQNFLKILLRTCSPRSEALRPSCRSGLGGQELGHTGNAGVDLQPPFANQEAHGYGITTGQHTGQAGHATQPEGDALRTQQRHHIP